MSAGCSASVGEPQADKYGDGCWMDLHDMYVAEAKSMEPEVLFIGDSLIAWLRESNVYQEHFAPLHSLCFGSVGDTTSNLIWRVENGELECIRPKVIFVSVGSFNVGCSDEELLEGIVTVAKLIGKKQPEASIFILKLLPTGKKPNPRRELFSKVNAGLQAGLADIPNVNVLDIDPGFITPDGSIDFHDLHDYRHLTQEGYKKAFEMVNVAVQAVLNPNE